MSLEELIESQRKDMRSSFEHQRNTISLNRVMDSGSELGEIFLSNAGMKRQRSVRGTPGGCLLHGFAHLSGKDWRCRACDTERKRVKRRMSGVPEFRPKPDCGHGEEYKRVYRNGVGQKLRRVCTECDRLRKHEYYHANKERILAQKKEKARLLREKGLSSRGRPLG